jgi:alpha-tubulin suppressor-like RCC1 family protein
VRDDGSVVSYQDVSAVEHPRVIPGLQKIVATTARLALRSDGELFTWLPRCGGNPDDPQDEEHEFCEFPPAQPIAGLHHVVAISEVAGCYLALDRNGAVWGWGDDSNGLISGRPSVRRGVGERFNRRMVDRPTRIPLPRPIAAISAGAVQAGAVDRQGDVRTWGAGYLTDTQAPGESFYGKAGFVAKRVAGLPPIRHIDMYSTAYAVTRTADVWRWGVSRVDGVRGSNTPSKVAGLRDVVSLSHTGFFTAVMDREGIVLFVGIAPDSNSYGRFTDEPHATKLMPRAKFISAGARITADGSVLYFGRTGLGMVQLLDLGK